jgi:type II secretory pathway pseudopilin PulG
VRARLGRRESGETLVELLVTVVILGTSIVAVVLGVATAVASSDSHRQEATAEGVLRSLAERIADPRDVPYQDCATTGTYSVSPPGFNPPPGWTLSVTNVAYLQGDNTYGASCGTDLGAQQLSLRAQSPHVAHQATETVVIVKRRP